MSLPISDTTSAAQQMEATILRQLLSASGAFKPSDVAGGQLRADMFIETLADAVAKGGGIGIARMLEEQMGDAGLDDEPLDGTTRNHTGLDLQAAAGGPIHAAGAGVVRQAGPRGGHGNARELDHGGGVTTSSAHAAQVSERTGETGTAAQKIDGVGHPGRATGPHLHFERRKDDRPLDPTQVGGVVHRALNAYQGRAEDKVAGKMQMSRRGDEP